MSTTRHSRNFQRYYLFSLFLVLAASAYPLYMGIRVVSDVLANGTVLAEDYPKYVIPYTPISLAVICGVLIMPPLLKKLGKWAVFAGICAAIGIFFLTECLLESHVWVTTTYTESVPKAPLEAWQMFMCAYVPELYETRTWTEVDILIGGYSPAYKMHFYCISVVLILSLLNCIYGFGHMLLSGDQRRKKALTVQSVSALLFLALCVFACFTAFYRTGELNVSRISAGLMALFFTVFGVTAGIFVGSFLLGRGKLLSVWLPAVCASAVTLAMYLGEMILLHGHLHRFGSGFLFSGLGPLVLAPINILIILLAGAAAAGILLWLSASPNPPGGTAQRKEPE